MADRLIPGRCNEPGPRATHCTEHPLHRYSCHDAQDDSSWNDRSPVDWQADTPHECDDAACPIPPDLDDFERATVEAFASMTPAQRRAFINTPRAHVTRGFPPGSGEAS